MSYNGLVVYTICSSRLVLRPDLGQYRLLLLELLGVALVHLLLAGLEALARVVLHDAVLRAEVAVAELAVSDELQRRARAAGHVARVLALLAVWLLIYSLRGGCGCAWSA